MSNKKRRPQAKKKPGSDPGTLEFTGERRMENPLVFRIEFNEAEFTQRHPADLESPLPKDGYVTWFDVRGLHDVALIEHFGTAFHIHPLVLEDILNPRQRPKFEEYGNEVFIIVTALKFDAKTIEIQSEQIGIYFGKNFLLTFQEDPDDNFAGVRERLKSGRGRIRTKGPDYLTYALMDELVDNYFTVLDQIEELMETIENEIELKPNKAVKVKIHRLKFQMLTLRKSVVPLREAITRFSRCDSQFVEEDTELFLRDLQDHVLRITDLAETYRDMLNGLVELYHSELSLRMNNVMQILTIITTIFVPLTFLAGVYGMNFDYMPELRWRYGYFMIWGVFLAIAVWLIFYFKRKKWV